MVNRSQLFYGILLILLSLAVFVDAVEFGFLTTMIGLFFAICGLVLVLNSKYSFIK